MGMQTLQTFSKLLLILAAMTIIVLVGLVIYCYPNNHWGFDVTWLIGL